MFYLVTSALDSLLCEVRQYALLTYALLASLSPYQDVVRMLKMVHGSSSEHLALPMIRYAQESGNDAVCKAIILTHLSEPNAPDILQVQNEHEGATTVPRDVGKHAQAAVRLLDAHLSEGDNMTMNMLVKEWRTTAESAPP